MRLEDTFAHPQMDSFNQRLAARCYLQPMTREQTMDLCVINCDTSKLNLPASITNDAREHYLVQAKGSTSGESSDGSRTRAGDYHRTVPPFPRTDRGSVVRPATVACTVAFGFRQQKKARKQLALLSSVSCAMTKMTTPSIAVHLHPTTQTQIARIQMAVRS